MDFSKEAYRKLMGSWESLSDEQKTALREIIAMRQGGKTNIAFARMHNKVGVLLGAINVYEDPYLETWKYKGFVFKDKYGEIVYVCYLPK